MNLDVKPSVSGKEKAILQAATRLFLKQGFGNTSMDAIAAEGGVAKQTIYSYFASKEKLFSAIMSQRCAEYFEPLFSFWESEESPRDTLTRFARHVMETMLQDNTLSLYRLVVAETPRFPELGRAFYAAGPENAVTTLASYLEEQNQKGNLQVNDARSSAEYFFGMLVHFAHIRRLLDSDYNLTGESLNRHILNMISAFLTLYSVNDE